MKTYKAKYIGKANSFHIGNILFRSKDDWKEISQELKDKLEKETYKGKPTFTIINGSEDDKGSVEQKKVSSVAVDKTDPILENIEIEDKIEDKTEDKKIKKDNKKTTLNKLLKKTGLED